MAERLGFVGGGVHQRVAEKGGGFAKRGEDTQWQRGEGGEGSSERRVADDGG